MVTDVSLQALNATQLRELAQSLIARVSEQSAAIARQESELTWRQGKIDKLTQELALEVWRQDRKPVGRTDQAVR